VILTPIQLSFVLSAGTTGMPPKFVLDNIQAVVENAVLKIPRKWSNIRSISIKMPTSMSLPFYNKTPDELKQISEMAGLEKQEEPQLKEEVVKAEKEKKRKLAAKSPLVQALKMLENDVSDESIETKKKADKQAEYEFGKSKGATKGSAKKKKRKVSAEVDDVEPKVSKNEAKKSTEKKMGEHVPPQESEETKRKAGKTAESGTSKELTTDSATKKKRAMSTEVNDGKPRVTKKETNKSKVQDDFIASKKYKGSKEGHVFRSGKQGVGYYVDVKPVVDQTAMEAFKRLGTSQSGGRGRKSSKSPGRKGRR
jgi:hypothetical protein